MPKLPEGDVTSVVISRNEARMVVYAQRRPLADQPLRCLASAEPRPTTADRLA